MISNGRYGSDVLEWELPVSVVEALLVDHAVGCRGRNIRWCTRDYEKFGEGFGEDDEMQAAPLMDKERPIIQPRAVKAKTEQRRRSVERAEVFTPSWICNKQNNLVDAAWFRNKNKRSPFNKEIDRKDGSHGWETTPGDVKFPPGVKWYDYVKANRLEVSCGEAPYITSRYDSVTGIYIEPHDRIGFLDRKLRIVTENVPPDPQIWFHTAKLAVKSCYGFEWQGDNVFLARENILASVIEAFNENFSLTGLFSEKSMLELAEIISWNIWQMDGVKFVSPNTCEDKVEEIPLLDGTVKRKVRPCKGCKNGKVEEHNGIRCRVMDWEINKPVLFMPPFEFKPIEEQELK